jgi:hypothetical protein
VNVIETLAEIAKIVEVAIKAAEAWRSRRKQGRER